MSEQECNNPVCLLPINKVDWTTRLATITFRKLNKDEILDSVICLKCNNLHPTYTNCICTKHKFCECSLPAMHKASCIDPESMRDCFIKICLLCKKPIVRFEPEE